MEELGPEEEIDVGKGRSRDLLEVSFLRRPGNSPAERKRP